VSVTLSIGLEVMYGNRSSKDMHLFFLCKTAIWWLHEVYTSLSL